MKNQLSTLENGLQEEIMIELATDRVIQNATSSKISLKNLYHGMDPYQPHSYAGFSPLTQVGFAELHGRREAQEDRIAFGTLPNFHRLSEEQRQATLMRAITTLAQVDHHYFARMGSTLCVTIIEQQKLYTASVGDSSAYLVTLDAAHQITQTKRLNLLLHHPQEPFEINRLKKAEQEDFIRHNRLMGLALSRAIGDTDLEPFGLIHTPDIYHDTVTIPPDGKVFVIIACDGLTEGDCLSLQTIAELVKAHATSDNKEIAKTLAHTAILEGSGDNVSVLVTTLDPTFPATRYMGVFDGHGGVECADHLRQQLHAALMDAYHFNAKK